MKKLSIVIVTYNSQKDILNCIKSIFEQSDIPRNEIEVIIVDNSNNENYLETKSLVENSYVSEIKIYHNEKNGGYGQGNNIGIKHATSKIVCIANPDIVFRRNIFKKTIQLFQNDPNLAMIGGKQIGGPDISFWIRPEYDLNFLITPVNKILNLSHIYLEKFYYLSGAMLFLDKAKFEEIGLFDEDMFMYCEEADITRRFLQKNYKTIYRSDFEYLHLIDDRKESSETNIKFNLDSCKIYLRKHGLSFEKYYKRRIFSFKMLTALGKIFGRTKLAEKNSRYSRIFTDYYSSYS